MDSGLALGDPRLLPGSNLVFEPPLPTQSATRWPVRLTTSPSPPFVNLPRKPIISSLLFARRRQKPRRKVRGFCLMSAGTACGGQDARGPVDSRTRVGEFGSPERVG